MSSKLKREVGNWVSGDKFWGREVEIQSFTELLDEGANILLTAPRRTGLHSDDAGYVFASQLVRDWWKARFGFDFVPAAKRRG